MHETSTLIRIFLGIMHSLKIQKWNSTQYVMEQSRQRIYSKPTLSHLYQFLNPINKG